MKYTYRYGFIHLPVESQTRNPLGSQVTRRAYSKPEYPRAEVGHTQALRPQMCAPSVLSTLEYHICHAPLLFILVTPAAPDPAALRCRLGEARARYLHFIYSFYDEAPPNW